MKKLKIILTAVMLIAGLSAFSQTNVDVVNNTNCDILVSLYDCESGTPASGVVQANDNRTFSSNSEYVYAEVVPWPLECDLSFSIIADQAGPCALCNSYDGQSSQVSVSTNCGCAPSVNASWTVNCSTETGTLTIDP